MLKCIEVVISISMQKMEEKKFTDFTHDSW